MSKFYYAVRRGRTPGIYESWEECRQETGGFPAAVYKKFPSREEAERFLSEESSGASAAPLSPESEYTAIAYVDGSYHAAKGIYGYGVVLLFQSGSMLRFQGSGSDPELASMRNVAGEIHGAMRAVTEAERLGLHSLTICYDYMGIEYWAEGSWKRNKAGTKAYYEFMQERKQRLSLHFQKVKAHSGVEYNELADRLAKEAAGIL